MTPEGIYAGFPHIDGEGVKLMRHDTGDDSAPATVWRGIDTEGTAQIARFLVKHMPAANGPLREALTCLYTMAPDNYFILLYLPFQGESSILLAPTLIVLDLPRPEAYSFNRQASSIAALHVEARPESRYIWEPYEQKFDNGRT